MANDTVDFVWGYALSSGIFYVSLLWKWVFVVLVLEMPLDSVVLYTVLTGETDGAALVEYDGSFSVGRKSYGTRSLVRDGSHYS